MQRAFSFSKTGITLDKNLHTILQPTDLESLKEILREKSSISLRKGKNQKSNKQAKATNSNFHKTINRQTLSSFQKCHNKVQNINAIYNQKIELTKKKHSFYSMKKNEPQSYFQTAANFYKSHQDQSEMKPCPKLLKTLKSQRLLKTQNNQDSHQYLKSLHFIEFQKQTERPFYVQLSKLQSQSRFKDLPTSQKDQIKDMQQKKLKMQKIHAFSSYSQRSLLNPQKIPVFSSALNAHNVNLKHYKQRSQQANLRFDKFVGQIRTRYDRDSLPWIVKLSYDCKEQITQSSRSTRAFQKQSDRKGNEVHSKYPIRIAM